MRRALVALALLGVAMGVVAAGVATRLDDVEGQPVPGEVSLDTATVPQTVPLRLSGGHLLVDVSLGSDGQVMPMLLDTGAPTMLSAELAARIGAEHVGRARVTSLAGRSMDVEVVRIGELRIGEARFSNVTALVGALASDGPLADIAGQGIVGADLMAAAVWQIDYQARRLSIAADTVGLGSIDGAIRLPFLPASTRSPSPIVRLGIDGTPRSVLLDTGSDAGLVMHQDLVKDQRPHVPASPTTVESWDGSHELLTRSLLVCVRVGGLAARRLTATTLDLLPVGIALVGNAFLDDYVVTSDGPEQTIHLFPSLRYETAGGGLGGGRSPTCPSDRLVRPGAR